MLPWLLAPLENSYQLRRKLARFHDPRVRRNHVGAAFLDIHPPQGPAAVSQREKSALGGKRHRAESHVPLLPLVQFDLAHRHLEAPPVYPPKPGLDVAGHVRGARAVERQVGVAKYPRDRPARQGDLPDQRLGPAIVDPHPVEGKHPLPAACCVSPDAQRLPPAFPVRLLAVIAAVLVASRRALGRKLVAAAAGHRDQSHRYHPSGSVTHDYTPLSRASAALETDVFWDRVSAVGTRLGGGRQSRPKPTVSNSLPRQAFC